MSKVLWTVAALLITAMSAAAHHAFAAEYDVNQVVTFSGEVTKFEWMNPHAWLTVEGSDEDGKPLLWRFEMGSPNGLVSRGWTKTALKPGDPVTVDGYRAKDGRRVANARTVTLPGGRKLFGGFHSTPGAPVK